jgi:hypothetical protein
VNNFHSYTTQEGQDWRMLEALITAVTSVRAFIFENEEIKKTLD